MDLFFFIVGADDELDLSMGCCFVSFELCIATVDFASTCDLKNVVFDALAKSTVDDVAPVNSVIIPSNGIAEYFKLLELFALTNARKGANATHAFGGSGLVNVVSLLVACSLDSG